MQGPIEEFGKYHLLERIATGGMAEVYRARQYGMAGFERIVVIKRILDNLSQDEQFVQLFIDEARIAVNLLHTNIVHVLELGKEGDAWYIAMEYVHGLDLARLYARARKQGDIPIGIACFIVSEMLKGLAFAHERRGEDGEPLNIVHCDVSPQNVLISFAGEVKLTDFGISRAAFQTPGLHQVIRGKYAYMSPEQVEGRELDARSDLFSTGIVLYELLTGRRLFKARTREETLARVRRAEVPSPRGFRSEISEDLEDILLTALARRREDRFSSAAEFHEALNVLMVREGHRVGNADLASWMAGVLEAATTARPVPAPPPRSIAAPRTSPDVLVRQWEALIARGGGEVWERGEGSLVVVWVARGGLREALGRAVGVAEAMQEAAAQAGYRLSAGICPGVARLSPDTRRPAPGWEVAGPFYLARWMMNLSAHRGRVLLSGLAARQVDRPAVELGRIPIQGNRTIDVLELVR